VAGPFEGLLQPETRPYLPDQNKYAQKALKAWQQRQQVMGRLGIDPDALRGVIEYDLKRVQKGQQPLSHREAGMITRAIVSGEPVTPAPEGDSNAVVQFFSRIPEEAKEIA
jgi:hypothetical protein